MSASASQYSLCIAGGAATANADSQAGAGTICERGAAAAEGLA